MVGSAQVVGMTTHDTYDSHPGVNISTLKVLWSMSPLHYQHAVLHGLKATLPLIQGSALHCSVFEPGVFASRYVVRPEGLDGRTKEGKAWLAQHESSRVDILPHDVGLAVEDMRRAIYRNPEARRILEAGGKPEEPVYWIDSETAIVCKGRLDLLGPNAIIGLKTTRKIKPARFASEAAALGYHLQWAFYRDGVGQSHQIDLPVIEIVVENIPPYDVVVYDIPEEVLDAGRDAYRDSLKRLDQCRETGEFPGVATGRLQFQLPAWAAHDEDVSDLGLDWEAA